MTKTEIKKLLKKRSLIIDKSYKDKREDKVRDERIDAIRDEIIAAIKANFDSYEVDFIIETYTMFGFSPCVAYDDNGMFAVSPYGVSIGVFGHDKIDDEVSMLVETYMWKNTIREALRVYVFKEYKYYDRISRKAKAYLKEQADKNNPKIKHKKKKVEEIMWDGDFHKIDANYVWTYVDTCRTLSFNDVEIQAQLLTSGIAVTVPITEKSIRAFKVIKKRID